MLSKQGQSYSEEIPLRMTEFLLDEVACFVELQPDESSSESFGASRTGLIEHCKKDVSENFAGLSSSAQITLNIDI